MANRLRGGGERIKNMTLNFSLDDIKCSWRKAMSGEYLRRQKLGGAGYEYCIVFRLEAARVRLQPRLVFGWLGGRRWWGTRRDWEDWEDREDQNYSPERGPSIRPLKEYSYYGMVRYTLP